MKALVAITLAAVPFLFQSDAARVLADMRQALGGEAALAAVRAFSVSGYESVDMDPRAARALGPDIALSDHRASVTGGDPGKWTRLPGNVDIEWTAALPDSAVRVRRMPSPEWGRGTVTTDGFRGDALIDRYEGDGAILSPVQAGTPAQRAAAEAEVLRRRKREFSMLAMALIGQAGFDSPDMSYDAQRSVAGRPCDVLRLRWSDGTSATLAVDAATHLPFSISWTGPAGFLVASRSTEFVTSGQPPPGASAFPPPATPGDTSVAAASGGQASVMEYWIQFDDFKVVNGLKWPHRFTMKTGDLFVQTTRVRKYKLNPKIDPKLLDPARR